MARTGYLMTEYSAVATGITIVSFLVAGMDTFIDLDRSYLEVELQRLNNNSTNSIVAEANSASDAHKY